jgi:hypothetical protein
MGVEVGNYCTTSFILKDAESVEYIKKLCDLLTDEANLSSGYLSDDAYCDLVSYGKEENSFFIKAGGFMDAGVDIRYSALHDRQGTEEDEVDEDEDYESINLWEEIQKHLKEDAWFFVDEFSWGRSYATTSVSFYHQNGKTEYESNYNIKKHILKKMGI